jgi:hypothetical protein
MDVRLEWFNIRDGVSITEKGKAVVPILCASNIGEGKNGCSVRKREREREREGRREGGKRKEGREGGRKEGRKKRIL